VQHFPECAGTKSGRIAANRQLCGAGSPKSHAEHVAPHHGGFLEVDLEKIIAKARKAAAKQQGRKRNDDVSSCGLPPNPFSFAAGAGKSFRLFYLFH
jgi:hypothetical protein